MTIIGSRLFIHSREARDGVFRPELEMESLVEIQFAAAPPPRTFKTMPSTSSGSYQRQCLEDIEEEPA
jgi:hypothetical protein